MLTFGDVEMNLGDVDITEEGDEAELLVPSFLKLLMDLLRQMLRNFVGSLFSLLLSLDDGERMKGFVETPAVVGV